ncbi:MAG: glucuronate isomerase [Clostridia bacterium]|nr:glucuronate isomerase [Clostridia bacterium]
MQRFMDKDFLLTTQTARVLDHMYAAKMPIIDYHCHLSPAEIAEDKRWSNISELWLGGDHYKWRAMRSCGIDEACITGNASDYEKFRAWCRCMPQLIGNPLYHWSHLELRRYFDCDLIINEKNCDAIWRLTAEKLADPAFSAKGLITRSRVKLLCTTDDPCDALADHEKIAADKAFTTRVLPAFRPDKVLALDKPGITAYFARLGDANGVKITDLASLEQALTVALDRFAAHGCLTADHGVNDAVTFVKPDPYHAEQILKTALASDGRDVSPEQAALFRAQMMRFLGREYVKRGWVSQIHFGVLRNPNARMFDRLGPDSGFDVIHGGSSIAPLAALLSYLESEDALPRTVLYSINPAEDAAVAVLCGAFQRGNGSGRPTVTQGSAWWFNDNLDGMRRQMQTLANESAFGHFLGMLTDSRSFLSYPRHEYFRRILCALIGDWVESGLYPADMEALAQMVCDICYNNTKDFFGFTIEH